MRIDRTRKHQGKTGSDRNWHLNAASPRHFLTQRFEAGLRAHEIWRAAFPGILAQWLSDAPTLAYRCGGSTSFGSSDQRSAVSGQQAYERIY